MPTINFGCLAQNRPGPPPDAPAVLLFDWDATLGRTMNGNKVVTWTDQVGGIVFSQANDDLRGEYIPGEFSIKFTEVGGACYETLTAPGNIPKPYSLVICLKRGANNTLFPNATVRYYSRLATAHGLHKYSWNPTPAFNCGDAGEQSTGIAEDGNYHVAVRTFNIAGNSVIYRDTFEQGSTTGSTDYSGPTGANIELGGNGQDAGAGNFWIRRILVYSGVLTPAQISQLQIDLMPELPDLPNITTTSLPNGTEGQAYSQQLAATGDGTITWSVLYGLLPDGVNLSSTGLLSGASILENGSFAFTVQASSEYGSDTQDYILFVEDAPPAGIPVFVGPSISDQAWDTDEVVSLDVSALFTGETSYELVPPWPLGITINGSGVISGTAPATEFANPRCCVKAINANGEAISNFFEVTVTDPTPVTNNLIMNSRMIASDPTETPNVPWHWIYNGIGGGSVVRTHIPAISGYELEITTAPTTNAWMTSKSYYGFLANVKYTIMADCEADAGNDTIQTPFSLDPGGGGFIQHSSTSFHQIPAGVTKRAFLCFSHTSNVSRSIQLYIRRTAAANKLKVRNLQLVQGEYLTLESLPTYEPTGLSSDGTYITVRDLGTVGRVVDPKEFMLEGVWWGYPNNIYNVNTALANENNLYYSPRPESPRLEMGSMKAYARWGNVEVSPGVFDWSVTDATGRPANKLALTCSVFNLPFTLVVGWGPPSFYPAWRQTEDARWWVVKDFTKIAAYIDAVLDYFVPLGLYALELDGEPGNGTFWGERDTAPSTTAQWRAAAACFARFAKIIHDRIDVYNAANNTTVRLFAPGDTSNFDNAQRFANPGYTPEHGAGCLDGNDGAAGIGIDHLDGLSFHGYYGAVDTGARVVKTIDQIQKWAKNLGRPDIPLWCSEGLGDEVPLTAFSTSPFATQCKFMLGVNGAMVAFDSLGYTHYGWDLNGAGFYGAVPWPPPQGDYTTDWVDNYSLLEPKWNALKSLLTTGGRRVYACRMRESDMVIEILVGTSRAGATWYAMDETFTGA